MAAVSTMRTDYSSPGGHHSCRDIQQIAGAMADGEYDMLVGGKNVSIYCHMMNTTMPKEFLTLPMGEEQNYSEVYGMRLTAPGTCPTNVTRDSCPCVKDKTPRAGLTVWKKISLNVTRLSLKCEWYQNMSRCRVLTSTIHQHMITHSQDKSMVWLCRMGRLATASALPTVRKEDSA